MADFHFFLTLLNSTTRDGNLWHEGDHLQPPEIRKTVENDGFSTDPDILRLMVNCSHMSDASKVSWGPTSRSSSSQNSLVSSTEAKKRWRRREEKSLWGHCLRGWVIILNKQQNKWSRKRKKKYVECICWVGIHSPLIIKQAAALIAWKTADQRRWNIESRSHRLQIILMWL